MAYLGIDVMRRRLAAKRPRCALRYRYYEQKAAGRSFDLLIPEDMKWVKPVLGWCGKAVDSVANLLNFDRFKGDVLALDEIFSMNSRDIFLDDAVLSALITSCSFVYISAGRDGYPRLQVIDGTNATGEIDPITKLLTEGYAVLARDEYGQIRTEGYFTAEETVIIEGGLSGKVTHIPNPAGYPLLVPIINRPDAKRPFGHSRITRACMEYQAAAFRTLKLSEVSAAFYSNPQKYVSGLEPDAEFNGKYASVASFIRFDRDENGDKPTTGQYTAQTMSPYNDRLRMIASLFAGETGLTLDDLGFYTENPSTAEAINAAHEPLYRAAEKIQRTFGSCLLNVGMVAACLRDKQPYKRYILRYTQPSWYPVERTSPSTLGAVGDAVYKLNEAAPGFIGEDNMKRLTGLSSDAEGVTA